MVNLAERLQKERLSRDEIRKRATRIHDRLLDRSHTMDGPNFHSIGVSDLKQLFHDYDVEFFGGQLRETHAHSPVLFRLSSRLTSSAGTTTRRTRRDVPRTRQKSLQGNERFEYEIAISTTILFQSFADPDSITTATGLVCRNRLEALQRVFEHELIHLAEMLVWSDSKCSQPRFQSIARRFFDHREHTHRLVTSRQHALKKFGFRIGDYAAFDFEGQRYVGRINRIHRRATLLVQDSRGASYSDGKRYRKFYIPLALLKRLDEKAAG